MCTRSAHARETQRVNKANVIVMHYSVTHCLISPDYAYGLTG